MATVPADHASELLNVKVDGVVVGTPSVVQFTSTLCSKMTAPVAALIVALNWGSRLEEVAASGHVEKVTSQVEASDSVNRLTAPVISRLTFAVGWDERKAPPPAATAAERTLGESTTELEIGVTNEAISLSVAHPPVAGRRAVN